MYTTKEANQGTLKYLVRANIGTATQLSTP